jgi:hypothetical protein
MNDFNCELQVDDFIHGDDFLLWVEHSEWVEARKDDTDRRWDAINNDINDEWAGNQPSPF